MRFRAFIEAALPPNKTPFTGTARTAGVFNFPDLTRPQQPGQMPIGGYRSFSDFSQRSGQQEQEIQYVSHSLMVLGRLVTNIYQVTQMKIAGQPVEIYKYSYYDPASRILGGINPKELMSPHGVRMLEPNQFSMFEQMKIITRDPRDNRFIAVNIDNLKSQMANIQQHNRRQEKKTYAANTADTLIDAGINKMVTPTGMGVSLPHSVAPMGGR